MSSFQDNLIQAELALAAYSRLEIGVISPSLLEQDGRGFSSTQAQLFADTYEVVAFHDDPATGLYAVVFRNKQTGDLHLAIRGTEDLKDFVTDAVDIALLGSRKLQAQYQSLAIKMEEWRDSGGLLAGRNFTVTGHSLGGFLATGIAADYAAQVSHAYLFNSPGVGGLASGILTALGITDPMPDPNKISNIKADAGASPISGLGNQVAPTILIRIEDQTAAGVTDQPAALNHSQQILTDAIALQTLYAYISPNLSQVNLNKLINASGDSVNTTLESALDALRQIAQGKLLNKDDQTKPDRDAFYKNLYALQKDSSFLLWKDSDGLKLSITKATIDSDAKIDSDTGLATRYALAMLNPFTLTGVDYSGFNADGQLDRYDPATGKGVMTDKYLEDRSNFLERKMWFATEDKPALKAVLDDTKDTHVFQKEPTYYEDKASGYIIQQGPKTDAANQKQWRIAA